MFIQQADPWREQVMTEALPKLQYSPQKHATRSTENSDSYDHCTLTHRGLRCLRRGMPSTQVLLPELLYEIVEFLVAEYVDCTLAGYLKHSGGPPSREDEVLNDAARNPCVALLQTSYQVRLATLVVLSQALGIDCDLTRLGRLKHSLADYLHTARLILHEAQSDVKAAHKSLSQSPYSNSATMQAYILLASVQDSTATILSLPMVYSIQYSEDTQTVFNFARRTYVELMSGGYQPSLPELLRERVVFRLVGSVIELLACLPLRLNLCLRQFRIIKDCCQFTGQTLHDAYENSIRNIEQLKIVMEGLYDLELSTPSRRSVAHMKVLRNASMDTCEELCGLVATEDRFAEKHSELQDSAGQLRDMIMGQVDSIRLRG
ncbi:hypothetical protein BC629DRAFT_1608580 [Irpex lacteus]|nr:hypothetical protein BC629DRAFT_1608580 [Irpex lacteus]